MHAPPPKPPSPGTRCRPTWNQISYQYVGPQKLAIGAPTGRQAVSAREGGTDVGAVPAGYGEVSHENAEHATAVIRFGRKHWRYGSCPRVR